MNNIKPINPLVIFKYFLDAFKITTPPIKTSRGYRVNQGLSKDFEYVLRNNAIVLRNPVIEWEGQLYKKSIDLYIYTVKVQLGDIVIFDESNRAIVTLKAAHSILKIEQVSRELHKVNFHKKHQKQEQSLFDVNTEEPYRRKNNGYH